MRWFVPAGTVRTGCRWRGRAPRGTASASSRAGAGCLTGPQAMPKGGTCKQVERSGEKAIRHAHVPAWRTVARVCRRARAQSVALQQAKGSGGRGRAARAAEALNSRRPGAGCDAQDSWMGSPSGGQGRAWGTHAGAAGEQGREAGPLGERQRERQRKRRGGAARPESAGLWHTPRWWHSLVHAVMHAEEGRPTPAQGGRRLRRGGAQGIGAGACC